MPSRSWVPFGRIRYDNLKSAVSAVLGLSRQRVENERWLAFRSHYFEAFYCQPGIEGAHEKGGVEGQIGWFRRNHFVPVPQVESIAELNAMIEGWDVEVRVQRVVMPSGVESATVMRDGRWWSRREVSGAFDGDRAVTEHGPGVCARPARLLRVSRITWAAMGSGRRWRISAGSSLGCGCRRRPGRAGVTLPWVDADLSAATVNRKLSALRRSTSSTASRGRVG